MPLWKNESRFLTKMYDQIARFYDLTHADLTADLALILALAKAANGPVLELGCGSGRILLPLARAGHTVTGVDHSAAMLARARERLSQASETIQQRVTLIEADMATVDLAQEFALVIIPYNTFMHLDSAQALKVLRRVRQCLAGDGRLFIDLINPFAIANTPDDQLLSLENCLVDPDTGDVILHMAGNRLDTAGQTLQITWIYDVSPAAGGPVERAIAQGVYHYRYPHQMELLLQETGFKIESMSGDYDQSPFTEESERLLIICFH
jgi:SAM-dependent methyltransferase